MSDYQRRIEIAGKRYFEMMNPDAERLGHTDDFEVYETMDDVVFVRIQEGWNENRDELIELFEDQMGQWFQFHDEPCDIAVRCDVVAIKVLRDDRAIVRYHVNAVGGSND